MASPVIGLDSSLVHFASAGSDGGPVALSAGPLATPFDLVTALTDTHGSTAATLVALIHSTLARYAVGHLSALAGLVTSGNAPLPVNRSSVEGKLE